MLGESLGEVFVILGVVKTPKGITFGAEHLGQTALTTSLPFVHTARRSYRLGVLVKCSDWQLKVATPSTAEKFIKPSHLEEGEVVTRFP
jgi:hypothetical protein